MTHYFNFIPLNVIFINLNSFFLCNAMEKNVLRPVFNEISLVLDTISPEASGKITRTASPVLFQLA